MQSVYYTKVFRVCVCVCGERETNLPLLILITTEYFDNSHFL
jgi:hypothetical protein